MRRVLLDENGWRIPRANTLSERIYKCLCDNMGSAEISRQLEIDGNKCRVLIWKIKHPAPNKCFTV